MTDDSSTQRSLAVAIAQKASPDQRATIAAWAHQLLAIRTADLSPARKGEMAIRATVKVKVIWPLIKIAAAKAKELGWDKQPKTARYALGGAAVGLALFGGQGAGIAALGTAIGVPLWVVFGAGAAFANLLIEEVSRQKGD